MPELPEVETVVRGLRPLVGRRITGVEWISLGRNGKAGAALRQILLNNSPTELSKTLSGARVEDVRRYGKNIVIELGAPHGSPAHPTLLVHLGMTGRLLWEAFPDPQRPHTHAVFALDEPGRWLHYSDSRRFGKLRLLRARPEDGGRLGLKLGPDPLDISLTEFCDRLRARRAMVKALLLDQRFLRGLGNIYADESLFRAQVHPAAIASQLNREQATQLHRSIRETLAAAIELGGSSISNYVNADGEPGWFQQEHQVYRRTGESCVRCGAVIQRTVVAGRSTHFCPRCQPRTIRAARVRKRGDTESKKLPRRKAEGNASGRTRGVR